MGFPLTPKASREAAADLAAWRTAQPSRPSIRSRYDAVPAQRQPKTDVPWKVIDLLSREIGLPPSKVAALDGAAIHGLNRKDIQKARASFGDKPPTPDALLARAIEVRDTRAIAGED